MSVFVLTNAAAVLGSTVLSSEFDGITTLSGVTDMVEQKKANGGGFRHYLPGLSMFDTTVVGNVGYDTGESGTVLTPANRGAQYALTVVPELGTTMPAGTPAIIHRGLLASAKHASGGVGEIARFEFALRSDQVQTVGAVAAPLASYTTSGLTGTAVAMTGPSATQRLYAALHVTAASGTNLAVKIQSDDNGSFTSATDRITFSTVSAVGWQFSSVAGNLSTETHWRCVITVASGTFTALVAMGVA